MYSPASFRLPPQGEAISTQPSLFEETDKISCFENAEQRINVDVVVIKFIKDLQHRSFSTCGEGDGG